MLRVLRRLVLAPSPDSVTLAGRGFPGATSPTAAAFDAVPLAVVCGFEWGIEARSVAEIERRLELTDPTVRGFACEGATMATTVLDATVGGHRTRDLLRGAGRPHTLLAYIGIGFAMARLPRVRWKKVVPELDLPLFHPTMSWLCVDGYGFDLAYFHSRRHVDAQRVPATYPWAGEPGYFPRAVDQGVGRALWFIHGGRVGQVAEAVAGFDAARHADLWSGVGLAAAFVGGTTAGTLADLPERAGSHRAELAVGAVFATRARMLAECVPEHTSAAVEALAGLSVAEAGEVADRTAVAETDARNGTGGPAYELWRTRIRADFATRLTAAPHR
jgi:enediyne biosynthesis protein E2